MKNVEGLELILDMLVCVVFVLGKWRSRVICLVLKSPVGKLIIILGKVMSVTDPISDMLTRMRNALMVRYDHVLVPSSKMKIGIARILRKEGFIRDYEPVDSDGPKKQVKIYLSYLDDGEPSIKGLKRVSKPGLRVYVGKGEIPTYYGGLGTSIMSTSKGLMTGKQAWLDGIGGELLLYVY